MAIETKIYHPNDLEASAQAGDRNQFVRIAEAIDWSSHPADELLRGIDLALSIELADLAIRLAQQGAILFPQHEQVRQAAIVLAPPTVSVKRTSAVNGLEISAEWLRTHANEYRGQWVAVREGQLLGAAQSSMELKGIIQQDPINTLLTKVL